MTGSTERARQPAWWRAAVLVCLVAVLIGSAVAVYVLVLQPDSAETTPTSRGTVHRPERVVATKSAEPKIIYATPTRLVIPKIGLNAPIEKVGLTRDKAMAVPSGPGQVGWYKFGPRPGNEGSAVLDGHSGYADGTRAAFDELTRMGKGDKLFVEDARGKRITFVVRRTKLYGRNADPAEVFADTSSRRLNLITCTGTYNTSADTHEQRLVVFAELQPPKGS